MRTIASITFAALAVAAASAPAFAQNGRYQGERVYPAYPSQVEDPADYDETYTGSITPDERAVYAPRPGALQVRPEFPQADRSEGEAGGAQ